MKYEGTNREHDTATSLNNNQQKAIVMLRQILDIEQYKDSAVQLLTHGQKRSLEKKNEITLLLNILPPTSVENKLIAEENQDDGEPWLSDDSIVPTISGYWRLFTDFADANKEAEDSAFVIEVNTFSSDFVSTFARTKDKVNFTKYMYIRKI